MCHSWSSHGWLWGQNRNGQLFSSFEHFINALLFNIPFDWNIVFWKISDIDVAKSAIENVTYPSFMNIQVRGSGTFWWPRQRNSYGHHCSHIGLPKRGKLMFAANFRQSYAPYTLRSTYANPTGSFTTDLSKLTTIFLCNTCTLHSVAQT